MRVPPRWSDQEFAADAKEAQAAFRNTRLEEPLQRWVDTVDAHKAQFEKLLVQFGLEDAANLTAEQIARVFAEHLDEALRYLTGPPISADDLKILAETRSLSAAALLKDQAAAARVAETILRTIDPRRFPWIKVKRAPRRPERAAAVLASAALLAAQKLATFRRNLSKREQEQAVKVHLRRVGLKEVKARTIRIFDEAPKPGEFCGESVVGNNKADIPVRLYDGRLLAIECKTSNSAVNSFKRVNHEAAGKAVGWLRQLGEAHIVPAAVLSGVFNPDNLAQAQRSGLAIFWSHRLSDLANFIIATKRRS
jgi:hypothetical protein